MLVEITLEGERLTASAAYVGLVRGVGLDVRAQVGLVCERLSALLAGEGFLAGVGADVALQQPGSGELLTAVRALAALVVCPHMHAIGRHGHVYFVTVRAFAGFLVTHAPVRLSVPR